MNREKSVLSEPHTYFYNCTVAKSKNAIRNISLGIMALDIYNNLIFFILTKISAMSK